VHVDTFAPDAYQAEYIEGALIGLYAARTLTNIGGRDSVGQRLANDLLTCGAADLLALAQGRGNETQIICRGLLEPYTGPARTRFDFRLTTDPLRFHVKI
jgi:hypothetical protein